MDRAFSISKYILLDLFPYRRRRSTKKEKYRKYERDPYDGLLDKLIELKPGKVVSLSKGTIFGEIERVISNGPVQLFLFQNAHIISKDALFKLSDDPVCMLNMEPNFEAIENLNHFLFFVESVNHPITIYPGSLGVRIM